MTEQSSANRSKCRQNSRTARFRPAGAQSLHWRRDCDDTGMRRVRHPAIAWFATDTAHETRRDRPSAVFSLLFRPPGLPGALSVVVAPAIILDQLDDEARYAAQHAADRPRQPEQAHGAPVVMQHPRPQKQ